MNVHEILAHRRREARVRAAVRRMLQFARYTVQEGAGDCGDDTPYAVVDGEDGGTEGCYATQEEADAAVAALDENGDPDDAAASMVGVAFHAVLCVEGMDTGDGRILEPDGGTWRNLPVPYMAMDENSGGGHMGARLAGRWEEIERVGRRLVAHGHLLNDDFGTRVEGLIRDQFLRFNSIDVGAADVEWEVLKVTEDGWPLEERARFMTYEVMGSTGCPFPALQYAVVWLDGMDPPTEFTDELPPEDERVTEPEVVEGADLPMWLLYANDPERQRAALEQHRASVLPGLRRPLHEAAMVASAGDEHLAPVGYFDEHPELAVGYFPDLRVERPDPFGFRRVYGYVAPWGVCHIGIPQECTTAPPSASRYAYFANKSIVVECDDCPEGRRIPVAVVTYGTKHADKVDPSTGEPISAAAAAWHYDNTGSAGAKVAVGENAFGIWISGVIPPEMAAAANVLDGANLSGDWRGIGGHLEMIAALCVNVPGFTAPPTSTYITASGEQTVLIASAAQGKPRAMSPRDVAALQRDVRELRAEVGSIRPLLPALRRLAASDLARELGVE